MRERKLLSAEDVAMLEVAARLIRAKYQSDASTRLQHDLRDLADRLEEILRLFTAEDVRWLNEDCDGRFTPETLDLGDRLARLVQENV